jgi:hypothetical protein
VTEEKPYEPFDSKGGILLPTKSQLAGMDENTRSQVERVLAAHTAITNAEAEVADKQARVEALTLAIAEAENELKTLAPPKSFMDLWRDMRETERRILHGDG